MKTIEQNQNTEVLYNSVTSAWYSRFKKKTKPLMITTHTSFGFVSMNVWMNMHKTERIPDNTHHWHSSGKRPL